MDSSLTSSQIPSSSSPSFPSTSSQPIFTPVPVRKRPLVLLLPPIQKIRTPTALKISVTRPSYLPRSSQTSTASSQTLSNSSPLSSSQPAPTTLETAKDDDDDDLPLDTLDRVEKEDDILLREIDDDRPLDEFSTDVLIPMLQRRMSREDDMLLGLDSEQGFFQSSPSVPGVLGQGLNLQPVGSVSNRLGMMTNKDEMHPKMPRHDKRSWMNAFGYDMLLVDGEDGSLRYRLHQSETGVDYLRENIDARSSSQGMMIKTQANDDNDEMLL